MGRSSDSHQNQRKFNIPVRLSRSETYTSRPLTMHNHGHGEGISSLGQDKIRIRNRVNRRIKQVQYQLSVKSGWVVIQVTSVARDEWLAPLDWEHVMKCNWWVGGWGAMCRSNAQGMPQMAPRLASMRSLSSCLSRPGTQPFDLLPVHLHVMKVHQAFTTSLQLDGEMQRVDTGWVWWSCLYVRFYVETVSWPPRSGWLQPQ